MHQICDFFQDTTSVPRHHSVSAVKDYFVLFRGNFSIPKIEIIASSLFTNNHLNLHNYNTFI